LHTDKPQICVGFIGYPNAGKSSVINTLRSKKVCRVAPIAGETKVWQYITLMKRIYLIDCPGVVYDVGDSDADIVLKSVVRVENLKTPEDFIPTVLSRVKSEYLTRTYGIQEFTDHEDFLTKMAKRYGRLLKKGEPDLVTVAKMVLNDWQRGKIPYYTEPPFVPHEPTITETLVIEDGEKNIEMKHVGQLLSKIRVKNDFANEFDDRPEELPNEEEVIDWDQVYENLEGDEIGDDEFAKLEKRALKRKSNSKTKPNKKLHLEEENLKEIQLKLENSEFQSGDANYNFSEKTENSSLKQKSKKNLQGKNEKPEVKKPKFVRELKANAKREIAPLQLKTPRRKTNKQKTVNFYDVVNVKNKKRVRKNPTKSNRRTHQK